MAIVEEAGLPNKRVPRPPTYLCHLAAKGSTQGGGQELLGHSSISITLDTYSHVLPNMGGRSLWMRSSVAGRYYRSFRRKKWSFTIDPYRDRRTSSW